MSERIDKQEFVRRVAARIGTGQETVGEIVEAALEEILAALKYNDCVSLKNLGAFHVRPERESWVFELTRSQRLRKLLGRASTYTGES